MIALTTVVITTIHPTIIARVTPPSHVGSANIPSIIAKPTDNETKTPVNQAMKFKTFPCLAIFNLLLTLSFIRNFVLYSFCLHFLYGFYSQKPKGVFQNLPKRFHKSKPEIFSL